MVITATLETCQGFRAFSRAMCSSRPQPRMFRPVSLRLALLFIRIEGLDLKSSGLDAVEFMCEDSVIRVGWPNYLAL